MTQLWFPFVLLCSEAWDINSTRELYSLENVYSIAASQLIKMIYVSGAHQATDTAETDLASSLYHNYVCLHSQHLLPSLRTLPPSDLQIPKWEAADRQDMQAREGLRECCARSASERCRQTAVLLAGMPPADWSRSCRTRHTLPLSSSIPDTRRKDDVHMSGQGAYIPATRRQPEPVGRVQQLQGRSGPARVASRRDRPWTDQRLRDGRSYGE